MNSTTVCKCANSLSDKKTHGPCYRPFPAQTQTATMTIKADWIKILKRANDDAFTNRIPSRPYVAFIDGQIKLM